MDASSRRCYEKDVGSNARLQVASSVRKSLFFAGVLASVVAACSGKASLDPSGFDRSCSVDTDCMLVEPVKDCSSCCTSAVAVRDTPVVRESVAEVDDECGSKEVCFADCNGARAVCNNGKCETATPSNTNGPPGRLGGSARAAWSSVDTP